MPPNRSEYQPLTQSVDDDEVDVSEGLAQPSRGLRRSQRPVHIDLSKLDNAFKRWTESIAQKVKRKKKVEDNSKKDIWHSVFEPQYVASNTYGGLVKTLDHKPPMTAADFEVYVQAVRDAIAEGIHPKMITKGSSGSYFARAKLDGRIQTVAVFKPKDEEPYGRLNPKTTKWLHRQFRWLIPFGRACLIPNLSYISEAAASLLDERMSLNIVPRTQLVSLSSQAFFYDWLDRNAAKKGKRLPDKIGSMQFFLHGFTDASDFLRQHPWPGRAISDTFGDVSHRKGGFQKKFMTALKVVCGKTGVEDEFFDEDEDLDTRLYDSSESRTGDPFYWTPALQDNFREELEKLVILDYLMLNTDRGADNYMIKYCEVDHSKSLVDVAPSRMSRPDMPMMTELRRADTMGSSNTVTGPSASPMYPQTHATANSGDYTKHPHLHIAAIDNSLSFPHEHPKGWRSYTYGWLYLPVTIIGRPFSQKTRDHFLPLLTSKAWWAETTFELRKMFAVDPDFHPRCSGQLAVIKGQAWNIVQSLRHADEGPLELTRRTKVLVWDDEIPVTEDMIPLPNPDGHNGSSYSAQLPPQGPALSPHASIASMPPLPTQPRRTRSHSHSVSGFPPPMRRLATDGAGMSRPVSFSAKFQRVHPATTGVTVLEHMERLDAVEAGLKRLGVDDAVEEGTDDDGEGEEVDVGESSSSAPRQAAQGTPSSAPATQTAFFAGVGALTPPPLSRQSSVEAAASSLGMLSPASGAERLPVVHEGEAALGEDDEGNADLAMSFAEEDLAAMSKSTGHMERHAPLHTRWGSQQAPLAEEQDMDWMHHDPAESPKTKTMIVERLETVDVKPLCSCW
ncbi:phosphatidylinositol 3 and 4-kinase-domain-containing protein [Epithele typhae]|uniref:phosphatidylinositol 3 and 4-kinase-domain-containing protein n=1 Tax=Epithele typhae TaxID=378194 RepID=UPI002007C183|nr:phosphatidylinositol 3 and 4-kinase-domain-containing protein [Epithele typhae]KAH9931138.1 phosphatidylinositol 3 and 4-kinase-domain-containing protein [Epithele typhae]